MRADPMGATGLREVLEGLIKICVAIARCLDRQVALLAEEPADKAKLFSDLDATLKIAERAQKILTQMRKDEGGGACMNSCETFAAAMLEASEKADRDPDAQGGPQ